MSNPFLASMTNSSVTANGGATHTSSLSACVDFFFQIGSMRGKSEDDICSAFYKAFQESPEVAIRTLFWARDVREGAGERRSFRVCLRGLAHNYPTVFTSEFVRMIPTLGRWDDLLCLFGTAAETPALETISYALTSGEGLCAKWMPREKSSKREQARTIRKFMNLSPAGYRKMLSRLTKVVESQMCSGDWDGISYSQVPSQAMSIYKEAFQKHSPESWAAYMKGLAQGTEKVNAAAIHPHEILSPYIESSPYGQYNNNPTGSVRQLAEIPKIVEHQWDSLPNWLLNNPSRILPVVDVSGSMTCPYEQVSVRPIDVSVSLGLYVAERTNGPFQNYMITFSSAPEMHKIKGSNLQERLSSVCSAAWGQTTNIEGTFQAILHHAKASNAAQDDMPNIILILSDMEFDACADTDETAMLSIRRQYEESGFELPKIVFWNLNARAGNVPVRFNEKGVALVSGFSPSIMKSLMQGGEISPQSIMLETVMSKRYNWS
jgi:hypothetical protein